MVEFVLQCLAAFVISTTLFDGVHFLLHRWQRSRWAMLRTFAAWHQVHHDFLDKRMTVHPELAKRNLWAHLVPECVTSIMGTLVLLVVFPWLPIAIICALHLALFGWRVVTEGRDMNHMTMDRLSGRRGLAVVSPSFHAMHHVNPMGFYSSFLGIFDVIFGTATALRGKRVLMTGASGAYGRQMHVALVKAGAKVSPILVKCKSMALIEAMPLQNYDLLVMCHGLKSSERPSDVWLANYALTTTLGDAFIAAGKDKLVPPEVWCVGSEAEVLGSDDYAMSKRQLADYAAEHWFHNPDVTYRHIVPSAFRSRMGWGLMSAKTAVFWSLFLIKRGFCYVPVTYTGIAVLNRLRFISFRRQVPRQTKAA